MLSSAINQDLHTSGFFTSSFNTSVIIKQLKQLEFDESDDPEGVPSPELN